jgi:hypothetical protein
VGGLNIAAIGANPQKPDIFVEMDWYQQLGSVALAHTHKPWPLALQLVVNAFANAPVQVNVNGQQVSTGMVLHIDAGEVGLFNLPAGTPIQGNAIIFQAANASQEANFSSDPTLSFSNLAPAFQKMEEVKSANMAANRTPVFHYCIWAHDMCSCTPTFLIAGLSEGIFTDDLLIMLGDTRSPDLIPNDPNNATDPVILEYATTFMHELGHNLNLEHGGNQPCPTSKRNYNSVMNYFYSILAHGIDGNCDTTPDGVIDYSRQRLDPLNEDCLDENKGVCVVNGQSVGPNAPMFTPVNFGGGGAVACLQRDISDCSNAITPDCSAVEPCTEVITGWDDWNGEDAPGVRRMRLDFRNSPNIGGGGGGGGGGSSTTGLICPRAP